MASSAEELFNTASHKLASTLGVLVGLAGIQHGILELLQGKTRVLGMMIDAIGPGQQLWKYASAPALTIIPDMRVTGLFASVLGIFVAWWSLTHISDRYGAGVFLIVSLLLFFVGGGIEPITLTLLGFLAGSSIRSPLGWWRKRMSSELREKLVTLWPWTLVLGVVCFAVSTEIAIFGQPLSGLFSPINALGTQVYLAYLMLFLTMLSVPVAFAVDIERALLAEGQPGDEV